METSLKELERRILNSDFSMEEWLKTEKEVEKAMALATEEEIQEFVDSGAGEMLDMTCSAIRRIRENG